jgi:adenylylsulfate kinase
VTQAYEQCYSLSRRQREQLAGHRGLILWYTGLSGAGKSSLANAVSCALHGAGLRTYVLDGDNIRLGLCNDLGFGPADRLENIRRVQEVARLFLDAAVVVSAVLISPYRAQRDRLRSLVAPEDLVEIYCRADLAVCEQRDVKGLYRRARAGEIADFTGVSAPYEEPLAPEIVVDTGSLSVADAAQEVLGYLARRGTGKKGSAG